VLQQDHHFPNRLPHSHRQSPGNDGVSDVQGVQMRRVLQKTGEIPVIQAMTGIDLQAELKGQSGRLAQGFQLTRLGGSLRVGVSPGMQFDARHPAIPRGPDLCRIRIDKKTDTDAALPQTPGDSLRPRHLCAHIQPALRRHFLTVFWYQTDFSGLHAQCQIRHDVRHCHLQIQRGQSLRFQQIHVLILNMAPVLAQMCRDGMGPGGHGIPCRLQGGGFGQIRARLPITGLAQRRHVIDIDSQVQHEGLIIRRASLRNKPEMRRGPHYSLRLALGTRILEIRPIGMAGHLEKVLKHAERKLLNQSGNSPTDLLDIYRNFLKIEEHRIFLGHKAGDSGLESETKRADLISEVLRHIFNAALENAETAHSVKRGDVRLIMAATGGFGRGQLAPYSDIDLLFLYERPKSNDPQKRFIEDTIQQVLYLLWDVGMKVGHASRTIDEAIQQGRVDFQTRTAYLESRLLSGPADLFAEFLRRFERICLRGHEQEYALWRLEDQAKRHEKFGNTVFLQEPNIKNSCGGLRDYQNLLWVSHALYGLKSTAELQAAGHLTASERKAIDQAYDFLLRIRNEMHYLQHRPGEILTLRLQGEVASSLKYHQKSILRRTEAMMREYYHHSRNLFLITNILARNLSGRNEKKRSPLWNLLPQRAKKEEHHNGFILSGNELRAENGSVFADDPLRMVQVFQILQQRHALLSPELERTIRRRLDLVNRRFLWLPEVREMLTSIVRRKGEVGRIIRTMHECGVLGRLIPEFAPLDCLVQHEFFHRYTADEHTIRCIEQLDLVVNDDREPYVKYRQMFLDCENPEVLYLALILHDTGKSDNSRSHTQGSAQNAVRFARRMKMDKLSLQLMGFLVDQHMSLTESALRRNLDDPQTIRAFARMVQNQQRLDLLMLMTFADVQGLGDSTWSGWKEGLVWQLYHRTREMLDGEDEFLRKAGLRRKALHGRVVRELEGEVGRDECEAHISALPESYLNEVDEQRILQDLRLIHEFFHQQMTPDQEPLLPVVSWLEKPAEGHSEVTVVTWDRDRLFSKIAGAFSLAGLNILSADIWTREDHIVIDRFRVCTEKFQAVTHEVDKRNFLQALSHAVLDPGYDISREISRERGAQEEAFLGEEVVRASVGIDNESSEDYTLLHLMAADQIGLLYHVSTALADNSISIANARITTEKGAALDTFYLTAADGKKILDPELQRSVLRDVRKSVRLETET